MNKLFTVQKALETELEVIFQLNNGLIKRTSDFELSPRIKRIKKRKFTSAAVLLLIIFQKEGPEVVLTRRSTRLKHHAGQIAFPGGKVEEIDSSEMETAIRESVEEVGLHREGIRVLGMLPRHETVTGYLISPFVALIKNSQKFKPEVSEVSEIFNVPLKFLLDKDNMQLKRHKFNDIEWAYYAIPYGPHYIWGATARIIKSFSDLIGK